MQLTDLNNPASAERALDEAVRSYAPMYEYIGRQVGINRCMFTGRHWITEEMLYKYDTLGRHLVNLNPDTPKLRVVLNRIPRFIHETAAATFPDMIDYSIMPPERDYGPEAALRASVLESTLAKAVKYTKFLDSARECNYRRCIDGIHGIGLNATFAPRAVGEGEEMDCAVKTFTFDPHRLVLDPGNQSLDLWDHEYVIYREVWTASKVKRVYGVELDPSDLRPMGELLPQEMAMHSLSQGRLYKYLQQFSETKSAVVYQIHVKDNAGRFSRMAIGIETQRGKLWPSFESQESPYGGNGLPLMLLHGYREPDVMTSQSDVALLKTDQDQINLLRTMFARIHQKQAGFVWMVPKGSMDGERDDYRSQFNNYVAGIIEYKPGTQDRPIPPPNLVNFPSPPPYLQDVISMHQERDMPAQIHRNPISVGATKSHVPDSTFQSALQAAGQVLGNRQREDTARYEAFGEVMLGTYVKLVQEGRPSVLVQLRREGFDDTDFSMLHTIDPYYPGCSIKLAERSIRFRSTEQKEDSLNTAAQLQMVSPEEYRLGRAALDSPITEDDRYYHAQARKWAMMVMMGTEWQPRSLGRATSFFLNAFQNAMLDRRAEQDPAALDRLNRAVAMIMESMNAEISAKAAAENPQPPAAEQAAAQTQQQEMPQEVNIADLLTMMESGAGGQMTQPSAA